MALPGQEPSARRPLPLLVSQEPPYCSLTSSFLPGNSLGPQIDPEATVLSLNPSPTSESWTRCPQLCCGDNTCRNPL